MRKALLGKLGIGGVAALAIAAACSSSTAAGNAGPGGDMSADGGAMAADGGTMGGMAHDMGQAATSAGQDMKQGAQSAGQDMKQGAQAAGQTMADAGTQAMGAAKDTASSAAGSAAGAASGAATTASDAARSATSTDGGMAGTMSGAADKASGAAAGAADKASGAADKATKSDVTVTDPQIAAIAVAANNADIAAAKVAVKQTKNAKIKEFANLMIKDHTASNKAATALVTKLKVKPEESDTSKQLKQGGDENVASLKKLKGAEFDKAYVDHEVTYHQQVLSSLDDTLIPNAKNEQLKTLLTKVRGTVNDHLEHAKSLQGTMGGSAK